MLLPAFNKLPDDAVRHYEEAEALVKKHEGYYESMLEKKKLGLPLDEDEKTDMRILYELIKSNNMLATLIMQEKVANMIGIVHFIRMKARQGDSFYLDKWLDIEPVYQQFIHEKANFLLDKN